MNHDHIVITDAQTHNLKNISLKIPKGRIVVFTGVSGSGKSSLVFDTIYTESQRQLLETFSSFARRRLPKLSRPAIGSIENISTAIMIDQKKMGSNIRSTVGTATEILTYLRLLFSRCGQPFIGPSFFFSYNHPEGMCPECCGMGQKITVDTGLLLKPELSIRDGALNHPEYKIGGWLWRELLAMDLFPVDTPLATWDAAMLERLLYTEGIPVDKKHGAGIYTKEFVGIVRRLIKNFELKADDEVSESKKNVYQRYFNYATCPECRGTRISERARSVTINGRNMAELTELELGELDHFLSGVEGEIARPMVFKMRQILSHLIEIGVGYLSLNRTVSTLSGGESQRVKMARQLDCDLVDMMYILDEPSVGLHPRDNDKLIEMLHALKERGNSVLVVEHDPAIIRAAEWVVDVGPAAGVRGGQVMFQGTVPELLESGSPTAQWLRQKPTAAPERTAWTECFEITNATLHNLKNVSIRIPKGVMTCFTGVAGSGKSSLVHGVFVPQHTDEVVLIDQSAIGRSSRSNPLTYLGIFDAVRKEFAASTGASPSLFSFNSDGACPKCNGMGSIAVEMSFLDDVRMVCDECGGQRYIDRVLALTHKGLNIDQALRLTVEDAIGYFETPEVTRRLKVLAEVGLQYLAIGQSLSTLSGGEAQRIHLASELHKHGNIYVLDEPTTGLHMSDIERLLGILRRLVKNHNTVLVIEHNLDVIREADWVIDLGPEGGARGGEIIAQGTPEDIARAEQSETGRYLRQLLAD